MPMPGISCLGVAGAAASAIEYGYRATYDYSGADTSTFSFGGSNIGPAASGRIVVVATYLGSTRTTTAVTIAGVSATKAVSQSITSASGEASIWYAHVPIGTTGTIIVTISGGVSSVCRIGVWSVYNAASTTPSNIGAATVASGAVSLAATVPFNGVGIVAVLNEANVATHTPTNYTERFDAQVASIQDGCVGGDFEVSATLSCSDATDNTNGKAMVYASWSP